MSTSGPSHAPLFVIKASLNEMSFEGSGKSKKDAKLNASKALLVHLHKVLIDCATPAVMGFLEFGTMPYCLRLNKIKMSSGFICARTFRAQTKVSNMNTLVDS